MKLSIIFSSLILLNPSKSTNIVDYWAFEDAKLLKYVCKVVNDITSSSNDTQDIMIGYFGDDSQLQAVNDVASCIDDEKALVITNFQTIEVEKKLRKAAVIVLSLERAEKVSRNRFNSFEMFKSLEKFNLVISVRAKFDLVRSKIWSSRVAYDFVISD
jgi:hypothetical protein